MLAAFLVACFTPRESAYGQITQTQFSNIQVKLGKEAELTQTMVASSDGGIMAASRRNGSVQVADASTGGLATLEFGTTDGALLTKRSADGKQIWGVGFKGNVCIQKMAATPNGGAIVGGVYKGPFAFVSAAGESEISATATADVERLFVVEVNADGSLGEKMLPEHGVGTIMLPGPPVVEGLSYDGVNKVLYFSSRIQNPVSLGNPVQSFTPTIQDDFIYVYSYLSLAIEWPGQKILSSRQMHKQPKRFVGETFGLSEVTSLLDVEDNEGGSYSASSFFGQIDEESTSPSGKESVAHGQGATSEEGLGMIRVLRLKADGANAWSKPLRITILNNFNSKRNYKADASVHFISPIGDGSRFVMAGLFAGQLVFEDGSKLESPKESNGEEHGYGVDAYIVVGDARTGKIIGKRSFGISLAGYVWKLPSTNLYPLSAVLDDEDLILGLPLQENVTLGGHEFKSMGGGKLEHNNHNNQTNSLIACVSLAPGEGMAVKDAFSLTHEGEVCLDAIVKQKHGHYIYLGRVKSRDGVKEGENAKLYLNGQAIAGGIADAKEGFVSIEGWFARVAAVKLDVKHPEAVIVKVQKNDEAAITYSEGVQMPRIVAGDRIRVMVELKDASRADFSLLGIEVNGKALNGGEVYTFDGSTNEVRVKAGAYRSLKRMVVSVSPTGRAKVKLKVGGDVKEFIGDNANDPKVTLKNGEGEIELSSVLPIGEDYMVESITVQGTTIKEPDLPYTYHLLPSDLEDELRIAVMLKRIPEFSVEVQVLTDFSYGKVTLTAQGGTPVVFEGDPAKYPVMKVRFGQRLTIYAEPTGGHQLESIKVGNATVENGAVYVVPESVPGDRLTVVATFSLGTAVECRALTTIALRGNPAKETFVVEGSWEGELRYALYSHQGILLRAGQTSRAGELRISTEGLQAGFYLIRVQDATGAAATLKAVKAL